MGGRLEDVQASVRALGPLIEANQAEAERLKRLPDAVAQAFLDNDLYRVLVPTDLGGAGLDPLAYFDLCMLPMERLQEFFSDSDCAIAGTVGPSGNAVRCDGGWKMTGKWSWMSGVHQSKWVILGAFVHEDGKQLMNPDGSPEVRQFLVPKDASCMLDVWDVGGMRGAGSTDYACTDAFTTEEMWVRAFSGQSNHPDPIFRLPFTYFGLGLSAVALGMARPAVRLSGRRARSSRRSGTSTPWAATSPCSR